MTLKLIKGNYRPKVWGSDSRFYDDEDIKLFNEAMEEASEQYPGLKDLIWNPTKTTVKPKLITKQ
jgi:hypothetical protein